MTFFNFNNILHNEHAVSWSNQALSYTDVKLKIHQMTDKLNDWLMDPTDVLNLVLICLPRSLDEYLITLSLLEMGKAGINAGQEQSPNQIEDLLKRFPIKHIITHKKFLKTIFAKNSLEEQLEISDDLVLIKNIFYNPKHVPVPKECRWTLLTSGSKGLPKIVMISKDELIQRAAGEIRDFKISPGDRLLNFLSFSHDLGFNQLLSSFMGNACLYIHKYVFLNDLLRQIQDDKITGLTSIANIWREFLKKEISFDFTSSSLKYFTVSGESLNEEELKKIIAKVGNKIKIYRTYGQTETFRSLICDSAFDFYTGLPLKDVQLKIDYDHDNETGELIHYGAGTMLGYLNDSELTSEKFSSDGGVKTGDIFSKTPSGHFQFICRKDDMKKINGVRFYPVEIENALLKHSHISECCVFLLKDSEESDVLVSVISLKDELSDKEIREFLLPYLNRMFIPHHFIRIKAFPKTHSGKIDRKKLQEVAYNFLFKR